MGFGEKMVDADQMAMLVKLKLLTGCARCGYGESTVGLGGGGRNPIGKQKREHRFVTKLECLC